MPASTLIASAKGKLDLEKAFKWTKEEVELSCSMRWWIVVDHNADFDVH
jgi:hypothetical protein